MLKKIFLSAHTIIYVLLTLLIVALGSTAYFYQKAHADPQKEAQKDLDKTVALVSRHLVLPAGEVPTLATVTDPEKLKDQAFFINAKKGNKVLIFSTSHKAILYDPVANKIVDIAPVNLGAAAAGTEKNQAAQPKATTSTKK